MTGVQTCALDLAVKWYRKAADQGYAEAQSNLGELYANGQGVTAAPAAGVNNRVIGIAIVSGVSGDIIPVLLSVSTLQG